MSKSRHKHAARIYVPIYIYIFICVYTYSYIRIEIPRRDTSVVNERLLRGENVPIHAQRVHGFRANAVWIAATIAPRSPVIVRYARCMSIERARVKGIGKMRRGGGGWRINVGLILRRTILNRTTDKARNDVTLRITGFSPRGGTMYSARKAVSNDSTIMCVFASLWGYPVYVCVRFARQRENAEATGYV